MLIICIKGNGEVCFAFGFWRESTLCASQRSFRNLQRKIADGRVVSESTFSLRGFLLPQICANPAKVRSPQSENHDAFLSS